MKIDINKISKLARLNLTPGEKPKLEKDLESILGYVSKLDKLDTAKIEPTSHVLDFENVYRKDEAKPSDAADMAIDDRTRHVPGLPDCRSIEFQMA